MTALSCQLCVKNPNVAEAIVRHDRDCIPTAVSYERVGTQLIIRRLHHLFDAAADEPEALSPDAVGWRMAAQAGGTEVHDLHGWEVTCGFSALSAHVLVGEDSNCHTVSHNLKRALRDEFDIEHTTLQVDHEHTALLSIEPAEQPAARPISTFNARVPRISFMSFHT